MTSPIEPGDELSSLLTDVRADTEWALQGELRAAEPDFGEAVRLAHELGAVSEDQVAEAGKLPVAERSGVSARIEQPGADSLRTAVRALQEQAEADVAARRLQALPELSFADLRPDPVNRWLERGVVAAAAAVLMAWGVPRFIRATEAGQLHGANQAELARPGREPATADARVHAPARPAIAPLPPSDRLLASPHQDAGEAGEAVDVAVEPPPERGLARKREPRARTPMSPAAPPPTDPLDELDARAQRQWQAGDLAGAEGSFREIIAKAPGSRHAELAYGDLFTLVRQRKHASQLEQLRREYLVAFPRGRFAEDARVELCAGDVDRGCWEAYLNDFPDGAHTQRARRALEDLP